MNLRNLIIKQFKAKEQMFLDIFRNNKDNCINCEKIETINLFSDFINGAYCIITFDKQKNKCTEIKYFNNSKWEKIKL